MRTYRDRDWLEDVKSLGAIGEGKIGALTDCSLLLPGHEAIGLALSRIGYDAMGPTSHELGSPKL